ncbi:transmembrane ascorbate-dependent reductase CYB561 isoform X4 [Rhinolophus sinicus]
MESRASTASSPGALPYYVAFSQLLGLMVVAMTGAWLGLYRGGIAWEEALQFNVHPLCMVIGLIFLQGDALLVYRVFRNEAKRTTKVLHGLLHVFAFVIALVGLVAVFDYHRKQGYADLYSLHSWCGMLVLVLYFVQWLVGFSFFLFPGASFSLRSRYRPQHVFFGATIFLLSVGTALLGLKEALLFKLGKTSKNLNGHSRPGDCREPAVGEETMAQGRMGAGYLDNTAQRCEGKGASRSLKFLEENEQEHLSFCKKGERHLHDKNIRESDCLLEKADQCV